MNGTLSFVSQDVSHMVLTIIGIATLFAAFVVPALLALRHGVDTRSDAWSATFATNDTAAPILGSRR